MKRRHVITIVAAGLFLACAGLLFPAIQKVRQAAARMSCHGRHCFLALTVHRYAAAHDDMLPTGTIPNADLLPEQRLSWLVWMLPDIEQGTAHWEFDLTRGPGDPRNEKAGSNRYYGLVCPASGEYERNSRQWKSPAPVTHSVGVAGVGADAATLPVGHPRAGVFGHSRRISIKTGIPDGTSNTLMLIETANNPGHWAFGGFATVRAFEPGASPYIGPDRPFGGFHNGSPVLVGERSHYCVAALADGSVRGFTSAISPAVLEALATVAGKEELPANW